MKTKMFILALSVLVTVFSCKNDKQTNTNSTENTVETRVTQNIPKGDSVVVSNETHKDTTLIYKVSLGIMPDLGYKSKGVKVGNVTKNRPGYYGGLQTGDIIVKIDDTDIPNLIEYTKLLGKHKKGDSVVLTVDRKGKKLKMNITFD